MMDEHLSGNLVAEIPAVPPQRVKILLVDDRQDKLLALASIFDGLDLELVTAQSGSEALRLLLVDEFAVILLDVMMPIMDGFETAALIRQRKSSERTPIIFVTAMNATETHASRGYSLGAVDYIFAPVIPEVLRAKVSVFIDLFKLRGEVEWRGNQLRQEAVQRADHLETRLEGLLNRLHVGVFRSTQGGDLITANPAFHQLYGSNPAVDPHTINLGQFYLSEDDRLRLMNDLRSTDSMHERHVRQRRFDGQLIWVSMSKTLVTDADGRQYIDGLIEDVTLRKEAETALSTKSEELKRSNIELKRSNAELEQFAYIASHDLQEPLRMVSSYSTLFLDRYGPAVDDQGRRFLGQVVDGSNRMQALIHDVLAYSQLGRDCTAILVDCNEVMERVRFNFLLPIKAGGVDIVQGPLPTVRGDPLLIGQIFQNLVGNAIKFCRAGVTPRISISAERKAAIWEFTIADNGIGIPAASYESIFQVFQRLHGREVYDGTGIGLAICRKAVQRLGGDIRVVSTPNEGSIFFFTIPAVDEPIAETMLPAA